MPRLDLAQNSKNPKTGQITPRRLAAQPVPPGASSANLENSQDALHCLVAGSVPPGNSSSKNPEHTQLYELPGGGSITRQVVSGKFQKRIIIKDLTVQKQPIYHTVTHY